ncbi:hypothetical protein COL922a_012828 [Colletotrichum nupharicola]|nr:hypothetical protein COL922a_012828 [Colletotrichum nupharicola]
MATPVPADPVERLRAFLASDKTQRYTIADFTTIVKSRILPIKQPFNTTHKAVLTDPNNAYRDILQTLANLSPGWNMISFIMVGGLVKDEHWSARALYEMNLFSFFDHTTNKEINPGALLWQIELAPNTEGHKTVKNMRATAFVTEDSGGRSLANRLDHGSKNPNNSEALLRIPKLGRSYNEYTIDEDFAINAPIFAFGHLVDTVKSSSTMEEDSDIRLAEARGGSGLYYLATGRDANYAWGGLTWVLDIIDSPHQDIRRRRGPTVVQFISA